MNGIDLIIATISGALVSGVIALLSSILSSRRARKSLETQRAMDWSSYQTEVLKKNLLVLETAGDAEEINFLDLAVRARLTPGEVRQAVEDLGRAGLLESVSDDTTRLTEAGRRFAAGHIFEIHDLLSEDRPTQLVIDSGDSSPNPPRSIDLDIEIDEAAAALRAQHAHA
jgi:DNA-binding MarR family transcriptional regulator